MINLPTFSKAFAYDYGVFTGETKAVDEYFQDQDVVINKFPFCMTPCYIVKN